MESTLNLTMDELKAWIGRSETRHDLVGATPALALDRTSGSGSRSAAANRRPAARRSPRSSSIQPSMTDASPARAWRG